MPGRRSTTVTGADPAGRGRPPALALLALLALLGTAALGAEVVAPAALAGEVGTSEEGDPEDPPTDPPTCTVDARLVNSCRPWFGATANRYPDIPKDKLEQMLAFEQRTGRPMEVAHTYHPPGDDVLSAIDLHFATRPGTYLFTNWALTRTWTTAAGGDPVVDARIDQMATSIKALGDTRIFLTLHHEPENDTSQADGCAGTTLRGTSGTAADYRAMWANVRARFDALGVTNVVWVMNYMNSATWDCMVDDLYPGDHLVDWIVFNGYRHGPRDDTFVPTVAHFYDLLTARSGEGHDYLSKPWGIVEWGIHNTDQPSAYRFYAEVRDAVERDLFPRLELFMVFDNGNADTGDWSHRVAYDVSGVLDPVEQRAFNALAHTPALGGTGPAADTVGPEAPVPTATVGPTGAVTLTWPAALDDVATVSYEVARDGTLIASTPALTATDAPTPGVPVAYTVTAVDSSGNRGEASQPQVVTVPVPDTTPPTVPTGLTAALTAGVPSLTWLPSSDAVGVASYDVLRNGTKVATTTTTSYLDVAAPQARTHTWTVRARDAAGNLSGVSAGARLTVPDSTAPTAPGGLTVARSGTRAALRWTAASDNVGVTGYWVYRGTTRVAQLGASARSYAASGLRTGTTYAWSVRARDAAGNLSAAATRTG